MGFLFKNLRWNNGSDVKADIRIQKNSIADLGKNLEPRKKEIVYDFEGHFIYPGFINSHDHLGRNLFPRLGNPPYQNYVDWANDIYKPDKTPLKEISRIAPQDLLYWGGVRNLIAGVTTVVHHDAWNKTLSSNDFPIRVFKNYAWAHSLEFEKKVQLAFEQRGSKKFIIHAAEGQDHLAAAEIRKLHELRVLSEDTIIVHGVAASTNDFNLLSDSKTSVVWCPSSNLFLFNKTAPIRNLVKQTMVSLGSDSTLTGLPTFVDELKCAKETGLASSEEVLRMITKNAALIFGLPDPAIKTGALADIVILPIKNNNYFDNVIDCSVGDAGVVMIDGKLKYTSAEIAGGFQIKPNVTINGRSAWIDIDVKSLKKRIRKHVEDSILRRNPLWDLID